MMNKDSLARHHTQQTLLDSLARQEVHHTQHTHRIASQDKQYNQLTYMIEYALNDKKR